MFGNIAILGLPKERPDVLLEPKVGQSKWRSFFAYLCVIVTRAVGFFCFGIIWVSVNGRIAPQSEAPIRLFLPHSSYLDTAALTGFDFKSKNLYSFLIKANSLFGQILPIEALMSIRVYRSNETKKNAITEEIRRRAAEGHQNKNSGWFPVLLAPEGTALSGTVLHKFKLGAFKPGLPVQPVYIDVGDRSAKNLKQAFSMADWYGSKKINLTKILLSHMMYVYQKVSITYCDVIHPTPKEKANPILYADNARLKISKMINLPIHDTTLEDNLLMIRFHDKYRGDPNYGIVKFVKLQVLYSANFSTVKTAFDFYLNEGKHGIDSRTGSIDKQDFLKYALGFFEKILDFW